MPFYSDEELRALGLQRVGVGVKLSRKASLYNPGAISIGDHSRIDDFCVLSAGAGGISIGRRVHVAVYVSLQGSAPIVLHDYCGLSGRVSIYSSNDDYSGEYMTNPTIPPQFTNASHAAVSVGRHVIIGAGSVVLPGVTLHEGSGVGALSLVSADCAPFVMYAGRPARPVLPRSRALLDVEQRLLAFERGGAE